MNAHRLLWISLLLFALLVSAGACANKPAAPENAREPASIMSWRGAAWLERPERASEDRPDIVINAMNLRNGQLVAEIGAGTGFFTRRLAREVAPDGTVWANDIQPEMLDLMKEYLARDEITNVVPVRGDEDDPKLPSAQFDWILLVDVYHEFQNPQAMLARIRESLKPHGRVALVEYRSEGTSAAHIMKSHRMSREQVLDEWLPAGFDLEKVIDDLPSQHLFIFRRR